MVELKWLMNVPNMTPEEELIVGNLLLMSTTRSVLRKTFMENGLGAVEELLMNYFKVHFLLD